MGALLVLLRDGANQQSSVSNGEVRWRRGFNFQNAWTGAYIVAKSISEK